MVGWNISTITAYYDDMLNLFTENDIPWCLCEAEGWPYRFLTVPDGQPYEWEDATLETLTRTYPSEQTRTFQYCAELLDTFRKYTLPTSGR